MLLRGGKDVPFSAHIHLTSGVGHEWLQPMPTLKVFLLEYWNISGNYLETIGPKDTEPAFMMLQNMWHLIININAGECNPRVSADCLVMGI